MLLLQNSAEKVSSNVAVVAKQLTNQKLGWKMRIT